MELNDMPNVKHIWCDQPQAGSFCNLTRLYIDECDSLEYVFRPYTTKYLVNVSYLEIKNCRSLKEVVSAKEEIDGQEEYSSSILPKLKRVFLRDLPALLRFCHIEKELEFPELNRVEVKNCPEFKTFAPGFVHAPKLESVNHGEWPYGKQEKLWKGNLNNTIQHIYEDQQQRRRKQEEEKGSGNENEIKEIVD